MAETYEQVIARLAREIRQQQSGGIRNAAQSRPDLSLPDEELVRRYGGGEGLNLVVSHQRDVQRDAERAERAARQAAREARQSTSTASTASTASTSPTVATPSTMSPSRSSRLPSSITGQTVPNQTSQPTAASPGTATASTAPPGQPFNINPAPQGARSDIYGAVPGATMVPDVVGDLQRAYPQLMQTNQAIGQNILSKLKGELSPEVIANLQNDAARFGVQSGMPGSGLQTNQRLLGNIRTTEALQNQGIQDYLRFAPTVSATQTVRPETQIGLSQANAALGAAPNPAAAGGYAEGLFNKYLDRLSASGISPAAGTGLFPGAAASFPGLMPQQPLVSRFTQAGGYQANQPRPTTQQPAATPAPIASPGGGWGVTWDGGQNAFTTGFGPNVGSTYQVPSNFGTLDRNQQNDYWTQLQQYSYMNPADYE